MKLKARYTTQEAVPEALRDYYVEQPDGKWVPNGFVESDQATKLQAQNAALKRQLDDARFKQIAIQTAIEAGAPSAAIPDVATRIENSYEMRDGQVVPRDPSSAPRSLEAFVDQLRTDASHLFDAAAAAPRGASAVQAPAPARLGPQQPTSNEGLSNPWLRSSFNLTMQNRIAKRDPGLARRLQQEAGVPVTVGGVAKPNLR